MDDTTLHVLSIELKTVGLRPFRSEGKGRGETFGGK